MKINKDNFYEIFNENNSIFKVFPKKIEAITTEHLREVYTSDIAKEDQEIVYVLRSEKEIPRLKGKSNIVYIGQTKRSFSHRYAPYAKLIATAKGNKFKYEHIVEEYGFISISICDFNNFGDTLAKAEGQLLWWYFQNHCEFPPLNYTKTKYENDTYTTNSHVGSV
jgi:hypothetical protein